MRQQIEHQEVSDLQSEMDQLVMSTQQDILALKEEVARDREFEKLTYLGTGRVRPDGTVDLDALAEEFGPEGAS